MFCLHYFLTLCSFLTVCCYKYFMQKTTTKNTWPQTSTENRSHTTRLIGLSGMLPRGQQFCKNRIHLLWPALICTRGLHLENFATFNFFDLQFVNAQRLPLTEDKRKTRALTNCFVNTVMVLKCDETESPSLASVFVSDQINSSNFTVARKCFTDHVLCCVFFHSTNKHLLHGLLRFCTTRLLKMIIAECQTSGFLSKLSRTGCKFPKEFIPKKTLLKTTQNILKAITKMS